MKTVVTGGAGFIGSHLVKKLIDQGRDVVVLDNYCQGTPLNLKDLGIKHEYASFDLSDYARTEEALRGAESVFHMAARVGGIQYLHGQDTTELEALQTNLVIDANVFRACQKNHVKKLVYASSVAIYPIDLQQSYNARFAEEEADRINPEGGYGWSKFMGEVQLGWMGDMQVGIGRIFNIYGENSPLGINSHVIVDLIRKAMAYPKMKFVVWGDGSQSRDFLHVSDCVDALLLLEKNASVPPIVVNIGSGEFIPIEAVARKVVEVSGKQISIQHDTTKPVGPLSRTADISRARKLLHWEPAVSLDYGIRRTYAWLANRLAESGDQKRA